MHVMKRIPQFFMSGYKKYRTALSYEQKFSFKHITSITIKGFMTNVKLTS